MIKAFVADLDMAFPAMAEKIGADFERLLNGFNRLNVLFHCLQDYWMLSGQRDGEDDGFYWWHCYSLKVLLNEIDTGNEIRWLLKLT